MSVDTVLDRLKLCHAEITGIVLSLRLPPTKPIEPSSLPAVWVRPMGKNKPIPATSAGQYIASRLYRVVFVVSRLGAALDASDEGAARIAAVVPYLDRFDDYYMSHPRLQTAALAEMVLTDDIIWTESQNGPEPIPGPGGEEYAGFTGVLTISERRFPSPPRLG